MPKFNCVFRTEQECPVKTAFKLQPESLVEYCAICHINPTNKPELRIGELLISDHVTQVLDTYLSLDKDERKPFLDALKLISELQIK